jgi:hypothetical protein
MSKDSVLDSLYSVRRRRLLVFVYYFYIANGSFCLSGGSDNGSERDLSSDEGLGKI